MLGVRVPSSQAINYGCYVAEEKTNKMLHYAEKPESYISDTINAGIYLFGRQFLASTIKRTPSKMDLFSFPENRNDNPSKLSMEYDVLPSLVADEVAYVLEYKEFWGTVKSAGSAAYANEQYLRYYSKARPELLSKGKNLVGAVIIDPTANIDPTAKIGPNVYIGPNSSVGPGVRISNSIILSNVSVKAHACILYSILGDECVVGQWSRLEGLASSTDAKRDPICVLGRAITVSPEIIIRNCIVMPHKNLEQSCFDEILL
jgi:mannose-1-phosphate guanylyltransferase